MKNKLPAFGFTLVETLLYLALYGILMTGAISAVYGLFESDDRDATSAMLEEEGDFLIGKAEWMLSYAQTIQQPAHNGEKLVVARTDGTSVSMWSEDTDLRIQEGDEPASTLNNTDVSVDDLSFVHEGSGESETLQLSFTLHATTSAGLPISRAFSALDYIRP